jgi:acyl carrier protein
LQAIFLERAAAAIGVETVTPADNFFDVGGDSLSAVELAEAVECEFGIRFPFEALFTSPSFAAVIAECEVREESA